MLTILENAIKKNNVAIVECVLKKVGIDVPTTADDKGGFFIGKNKNKTEHTNTIQKLFELAMNLDRVDVVKLFLDWRKSAFLELTVSPEMIAKLLLEEKGTMALLVFDVCDGVVTQPLIDAVREAINPEFRSSAQDLQGLRF